MAWYGRPRDARHPGREFLRPQCKKPLSGAKEWRVASGRLALAVSSIQYQNGSDRAFFAVIEASVPFNTKKLAAKQLTPDKI